MASYNLYKYPPSRAAAMIFLTGFVVGCVCHLSIIICRRGWYFIPLTFGCLLEIAGYPGRFLSSTDTGNLGIFMIQTICLLVASGLIFMRSLFRLVEYVEGSDGVLLSTEVYLYTLDALLMLGVVAVTAVLHPAKYVPGKKEIMAMQDMDG